MDEVGTKRQPTMMNDDVNCWIRERTIVRGIKMNTILVEWRLDCAVLASLNKKFAFVAKSSHAVEAPGMKSF